MTDEADRCESNNAQKFLKHVLFKIWLFLLSISIFDVDDEIKVEDEVEDEDEIMRTSISHNQRTTKRVQN